MSAPDPDLRRGFEQTRTSLRAAVRALDAARGDAAEGRYSDAMLEIGQTMLPRLQDADEDVNALVDRLEELGGASRFPG